MLLKSSLTTPNQVLEMMPPLWVLQIVVILGAMSHSFKKLSMTCYQGCLGNLLWSNCPPPNNLHNIQSDCKQREQYAPHYTTLCSTIKMAFMNTFYLCKLS